VTLCRTEGRHATIGSLLTFALVLSACAATVAPKEPAPLPPPPPPIPACGSVEVDDRSVPPSDARVSLVQEVARQKLAAINACARAYRLHITVTVDQAGTGRLRVTLRTVVYRPGGEMVGDIPTTLSTDHALAEERTAREANLLRTGTESLVLLYSDHFH